MHRSHPQLTDSSPEDRSLQKVTPTRLAHNIDTDGAPIPSVSVTTVCAATVLTMQLLHQRGYRQLLPL
ncbi:hypothetical protein Bpfe_025968 [Biomphalaria pfeifferi]|uniref:Uncharacterized protein n=1 Tax=Biomphalaria pfeifferi TaxID=112525 RepID=A0AAD8AY50_BIOPF|nr:hypothetical protein Bpfe_025968 [Biomphalaria pfeifferi]